MKQFKRSDRLSEQILRDVSLLLEWNISGVVLTQTYTLSPNDDVIRIRTAIDNRGPHWITGLFLGLEGLALSQNAETELLQTGAVSGRLTPCRDHGGGERRWG